MSVIGVENKNIRSMFCIAPQQQFLLQYTRTSLIWTLVIRIANYPNLLGTSGKCVENSTKLFCLEINGYRIEYSTVL